MGAIGRQCSVVNLDPANDHASYPCALDIRSLVTLEEIMADDNLGPNGGVLYAIEELENNFSWLEEGLKELGEDYVLFDCPGQVELYTHHNSLRNIFFKLQKLGYRVSFCFVVIRLTLSRMSCTLIQCAAAARCGSLVRQLLSDTAVALSRQRPPSPSCHAADGLASCQHSHKNRQGRIV